jgi:hypothetical protein
VVRGRRKREREGGEGGGNFWNKSFLCWSGRNWTSPFQQKSLNER